MRKLSRSTARRTTSRAPRASARAPYPLDVVYAQAGIEAPETRPVAPERIPSPFLAVTPNSEMMGVFWMREPRILYGRQTEMSIDGRKVGDIVEILPLV